MKPAVTIFALDQELLDFYENENIFIKETDEYLFLRPSISKKYFITHRYLEQLGDPIYRNFEIFDVDSFEKTEKLVCGPLHDKFIFTPKKSSTHFLPKKIQKYILDLCNSMENYENDNDEDDERADFLFQVLQRSQNKFSLLIDRLDDKISRAVLVVMIQYKALKEMKEMNKNLFRKNPFNEFDDREKRTSIPPTKRHLKRKINAKKKQDRNVFAEAAKICFEKIATQALILAIEMAQKIRAKTNKKKALFVGTILKEIDASSRLFFTAFLNDDDLILEKKENMKVLKPKKNARKQVVEKQEEQVVEKQEEKEDKEQEKHEENKQHECVICLCSISNIACVPCGHLIMCSKCFEDENNSLKECPLCRKEISLMVKIFI